MIALSPGPLSSPPIPANTLLPRQSSSYPYVSPFLPHVLPPPSSPPLSFRPHTGSHNWRVLRIAKLCHVEKTASSPIPSPSFSSPSSSTASSTMSPGLGGGEKDIFCGAKLSTVNYSQCFDQLCVHIWAVTHPKGSFMTKTLLVQE